MYDAVECLKGLSQILAASGISVEDALKAGEMIGALHSIINELDKEKQKEQQAEAERVRPYVDPHNYISAL